MPDTRWIAKGAASFRVHTDGGAPYREFWEWYESPEWEPDLVLIFERFLSEGATYLDFGAWIGPTVLLAGATAGRIVCVEPDPHARVELERNLALNPDIATKTTVVAAAIAATDGEVALSSAGGGGDSLSTTVARAEARTSWIVQALGISSFLARADTADANFVKLDVEGAEYDVVPAMAGYLRARRPDLYIALHPNLLYDKASLRARVVSGLRVIRANRRLLRAVRFYRYHYVYDERARRLRNVRTRNRIRMAFPLPLRQGLLLGSCFFTDR